MARCDRASTAPALAKIERRTSRESPARPIITLRMNATCRDASDTATPCDAAVRDAHHAGRDTRYVRCVTPGASTTSVCSRAMTGDAASSKSRTPAPSSTAPDGS